MAKRPRASRDSRSTIEELKPLRPLPQIMRLVPSTSQAPSGLGSVCRFLPSLVQRRSVMPGAFTRATAARLNSSTMADLPRRSTLGRPPDKHQSNPRTSCRPDDSALRVPS